MDNVKVLKNKTHRAVQVSTRLRLCWGRSHQLRSIIDLEVEAETPL